MVVEFLHRRLPERVRDSWPVNRIVNDVLIILVVLLGWLLVNTNGRLSETQNDLKSTVSCVRTFLIDQSKAQKPRNEANATNDEALSRAIKTIPPLLNGILLNSANPGNQDLQIRALEATRATNKAFTDFNETYAKLSKTRENFPAPPAPETLCVE